jgi:hypothetical protein
MLSRLAAAVRPAGARAFQSSGVVLSDKLSSVMTLFHAEGCAFVWSLTLFVLVD